MARLATLLLVLLACLPAAAQAAPYSSHSQLYACCTDAETKEAMFREAKDSGAAYIRVDLQMEAMFSRGQEPDWTGPDEVAALSRRFDLPVLAVLVGVPRENTDCLDITDWMGSFRCAPVDAAEWGEQAGQVAAHLEGVIDHFQIGNEPDADWAFFGDAADYARMLSAAYDEIHAQARGATVVLGPTMRLNSEGTSWLDQVFRVPGANAAAKFDVASMHLRGWMTQMTDAMQQRRAFLRGWGRDVPMWITEHGYSADSAWQFDPAYRGGEDAQASYLAYSLPLLAKAGAAQVFVTLRDGGDAQYAREGIVGGTGPGYRRKPAWYAVREAAQKWGLPDPPPPAAPPVARVAAPAPFLFRSSFVSSRVGARHLKRTTHRVTVSGRFRGRGCSGRVALTYRLRRMRTVKRTLRVGRDCRYRGVVDLRTPARLRRADRLKIGQRFTGNGATPAGTGRTLSVKLSRPPRRA